MKNVVGNMDKALESMKLEDVMSALECHICMIFCVVSYVSPFLLDFESHGQV